MTLNVGDKAPDFTLPSDGGGSITLSDYKGRMIVLYFYPKDDTPGCTKEACSFSENLQALNALNAVVIGVSKDSVAKHDKFKSKYNLAFPLVSDENDAICELYNVWTEKSMYGKTFMGVERSTYLIDIDGTIKRIWRKVKVDGHTQEIMDTISDIREQTS
jgi:peroxiredoxin Q/BCP